MLGQWIKRYVRDQVLAGVSEAVEVLAGEADHEDDAPLRAADLTLRLRLAPEPRPGLPAPDAPAKRKGAARG